MTGGWNEMLEMVSSGTEGQLRHGGSPRTCSRLLGQSYVTEKLATLQKSSCVSLDPGGPRKGEKTLV